MPTTLTTLCILIAISSALGLWKLRTISPKMASFVEMLVASIGLVVCVLAEAIIPA